ncbi:hypothetical protein [Rhizobium sp. H4]|uniref:hypothetical protein n=1 Tax=Rhizobium sp. H4 TaxID=2035449 RepID=UPI0011426FDA|nr:hypothetical protein [Rhizobium sp. H4]
MASTTAVGQKIDQTAILADGTAVHVTGDGDSLLRRVEITQDGQATILFLTIGNDGQYELLSGTVLGGAMPDSILAGVAVQISAATGKQVVYNKKVERTVLGHPHQMEVLARTRERQIQMTTSQLSDRMINSKRAIESIWIAFRER